MSYKLNSTDIITQDVTDLSNITITGVGAKLIVTNTIASTYGYASGGTVGAPTFTNTNEIQKFLFSTNSDSTDVGDLTSASSNLSGQSSSTNGYASGFFPTGDINKFSFTSDGNASSIGVLTVQRLVGTGQSSETYGYSSAGGGAPAPAGTNIIDKFPFATDTNATDVGDLTNALFGSSGLSSFTDGYSVGGRFGNGTPEVADLNIIDKFPFATDANASNVGTMSVEKGYGVGVSSLIENYGYSAGGTQYSTGGFAIDSIEKISFASDSGSNYSGTLTIAKSSLSGQSSLDYGYVASGSYPLAPTPGTGILDVIERFPFASDGNATEVGNLLSAQQSTTGNQV